MASGPFKRRYYNHARTLREESKQKDSVLTKYIWQLKRRGYQELKVKFKTIAHVKAYSKESGRCQMCSREKIEILRCLKEKGSDCLNRRSEMYRNCVHRYKHLLGSINTKKKEGYHGNDKVAEVNRLSQEIIDETASGHTRSGRQWRIDR